MKQALHVAALVWLVPLVIAIAACTPAPNIPHAVTSQDKTSCLSCHADGTEGAPKTRHPNKSDCVSCHRATQ